jgi:hypothetical protein
MLKRYRALDERAKVFFFDDFIGAAYDNRVWRFLFNGAGTLAYVTPCIGGQLRMRAAASNDSEIDQNDITNYSAANGVEIIWRVKLATRANLSEVKWGLAGNATYRPNTYIGFYIQGTGNYWAYTSNQGSISGVDTGIAWSANWQIFRITVTTGSAVFYIGDAKVATITANVTALNLQAFAWMMATAGGTQDIYFDYCQISGGR